MKERIVAHMKTQFGLPEDQLEALIPNFIQTLREHLTELENAVSDGNLEHIGRAAHTIKGALLNLGLTESAETARIIENDAKAGQTQTDYPDLLGNIQTDLHVLFV